MKHLALKMIDQLTRDLVGQIITGIKHGAQQAGDIQAWDWPVA